MRTFIYFKLKYLIKKHIDKYFSSTTMYDSLGGIYSDTQSSKSE